MISLPLTCTGDKLASKRAIQRYDVLSIFFRTLLVFANFATKYHLLDVETSTQCCFGTLAGEGSQMLCKLATSHWLNFVACLRLFQSQYNHSCMKVSTVAHIGHHQYIYLASLCFELFNKSKLIRR